ncbi:hypothetical protein PACTADRAFT_35965 [Pachysolen tannophilus NRRL Y-2460]|uniref:Anaphase-promoting complex subunit 2 n=1 Tax=Pachysolen tannophilus NRRL Y-2460 TaxID=669874 RepID=A0A1E4TNM3_PACTA|nr:hypothetical protein PACTADRAFT_35965 [Pachysolen tannophilus NRRL Y-2460]
MMTLSSSHQRPIDTATLLNIFPNCSIIQEDYVPQSLNNDLNHIIEFINYGLSHEIRDQPNNRVKQALKSLFSNNMGGKLLDIYIDMIRQKVCHNNGGDDDHDDHDGDDDSSSIVSTVRTIGLNKDKFLHIAKQLQFNYIQIQIFERSCNSVFQTIIQKNNYLSNQISNLFKNKLFSKNDGKEDLLIIKSTLQYIGLKQHMNEIIINVSINYIYNFINHNFGSRWEEPSMNILANWSSSVLYPTLTNFITSDEFNIEILNQLVKNELVKLRTKEAFDIIVDYPDSLATLKELKYCITTQKQRQHLVNTFIDSCNKRLLHAGANTIDIIKCYLSTIKSFLIIDPRGVLLDKVCRPIRSYLKDRDDTIEKIVHGLLDDSEDNELNDLAQELRNSNDYITPKIDDLNDLNWTPDPIDALPDFRKGNDLIESLISIFDSKDIFISEFMDVFCSDLLNLTDYNVTDALLKLELLKLRFGEREFNSLDVMVKDLIESKRIDHTIHLELDERNKDNGIFHSTVLSYLYWPNGAKSEEEFVLPTQLNNIFTNYCSHFEKLKQGRKLKLFSNKGNVELDLEFDDNRKFTFNVSPDKASIIHLFSSKEQENIKELSIDEIMNELQMSELLAKRAIAFWIKNQILLETKSGHYKILNSLDELSEKEKVGGTINNYYSTEVGIKADAEEEAVKLKYWPFIEGMLKNLGNMELTKIHSFLKMVVPKDNGNGYNLSEKQLKEYLDNEVKVEIDGNGYKLAKR